ncbi:MAG: prepilin-type N-terminal cleavage/methylation domain-containing protein [Deltaproteobacteria bacterium]|nr:prepilin-type N-terminal cleavage/methylation domain-containing protein [Deltaproteobacteria bacterium]
MRARSGFTLIELAVVLGVASAMLLLGAGQYSSWQETERIRSAARKVDSAFAYARSEAVKTGRSQIVFFNTDIAGDALTDQNDQEVPILILDDGRPGMTRHNCEIDAGEPIQTLTLESGVSFGVRASTAKVGMDDGTTAFGGASTFAQTGGGAATWVLFQADGTPRSANAACALGPLGSGGGGIYLNNPRRDVAVVLTPLGASRVFTWRPGGSAWN